MNSVNVNAVEDVLGACDAEKKLKEISIQDLLIWAVRDQCVMEWLDVEHDRIGGAKSQLPMIMRHIQQGGFVDGGNGVATSRMPDDAMRVGFAIQALGVDDRRLVLDCARNGDAPYRITRAWQHVNAQGKVIPPMFDKFGKRRVVTLAYEIVDGKSKRVRMKVCHLAPVFSEVDREYFRPMFNDWVECLELLTEQLSDLTDHLILISAAPKLDC